MKKYQNNTKLTQITINNANITKLNSRNLTVEFILVWRAYFSSPFQNSKSDSKYWFWKLTNTKISMTLQRLCPKSCKVAWSSSIATSRYAFFESVAWSTYAYPDLFFIFYSSFVMLNLRFKENKTKTLIKMSLKLNIF